MASQANQDAAHQNTATSIMMTSDLNHAKTTQNKVATPVQQHEPEVAVKRD